MTAHSFQFITAKNLVLIAARQIGCNAKMLFYALI